MKIGERTGLAFFFAPLIVPLYALWLGPSGGALSLIFGAVAGYGGMLVFGVPTWFIVRLRGWTALWTAVGFGLVYGLVTWFLMGILLSLSLGEGIALAVTLAFETPYRNGALWPGSALGGLVALIFWLIARPDRDPARYNPN
ncbi:MAG TPA: hypothetical protein VN802_13240 [Stellaceae bacterium]|nr:hypothetical protein [Stellaceae bacterium]HXQ52052.1 hypothetical protein [Stellaceae bacterium]